MKVFDAFTDVNVALPAKECWCLVWAPSYVGRRHKLIEYGFTFSKFRPNYEIKWSIDTCQTHSCVEYWMELPDGFELTYENTKRRNKNERP